MKPRTWSLPITTLIVNSDFARPNGTVVIEHSAYTALLAEAVKLREALMQVRDEVGDSHRRDVPIIYKIVKDSCAAFDRFTEGQGES